MDQNIQSNPEKRLFDKGFFTGLISSFIVGLIIGLIVFLIEYFGQYKGNVVYDSVSYYSMLTNIFSIPGVILILLYLIMFVSKEGAFDAIAYSFKLVFYNTFRKDLRQTKLPATYGDYRLLKSSKPRSSSLFLLFSAIPYIIAGIILLILYYIKLSSLGV